MLEKLKKRLKKDGRAHAAAKMGYGSTTVFDHWIKSNEIPKLAIQRVKEYLKNKGVRKC